MTQDDRMETITDPAAIRATDEPDPFRRNPVAQTGPDDPWRFTRFVAGDFPCCTDRAHKESLGGDSESGTYNRSNQPPAESRPDADNPWALLPDDHPKRPKQCGGCGTKWVDAETARACERRHGDDIATTPAPVGAAVELDLDAARAMLNAANTIKATGGAVEIGGVRIEPCDEYGSTVTTARAESAEAEVGTLRDTLARRTDSHTQLVRENETLRAKVAAVQALAEKRDVLYPPKLAFGAEENYCNGYRQARADFIAAMETGEGE